MESIAPSPTRIRQIGLAGLYIFAFSAFYDKAGGVLGLLLMLIAMGFSAREVWNDYKFDPLVWTVAVFVLYLVLHAYTSAIEFPKTSEAQWTEARNWGRLIVFLILAWWMRGEPRVILWCLALALLGLLTKLLLDTQASDITRMLKSQRTGFAYTLGFSTIISAASVAAMVIFTPRVLKYSAPTAAKVLMILIWFAAIIVLIQIQITTAFRGTWLAIAVVTALAVFFLPRSLPKNLLLYGSVGIILILLVVQNSALVENRVHTAGKTISLLMEGASINEIPLRGSVGTRLHLWNYGLKRWLERPLFGWGPGTEITKHFSPKNFTDKLDKRQSKKLARHPHLHNAYITVLAQLGLVGAVILALILLFVVRQLLIAYRHNLLPKDIIAATVAVLLISLFSNITQSRFAVLDFQFLAVLTLAVGYSSRYQKKEKPG